WQEVNQVTVLTIRYSEFKGHLARKEVVEASIRQDEIRGIIKPHEAPAGKEARGGEANGKAKEARESAASFHFRTERVEDPKLVDELQAAGVKYTGVRPSFFSELFWTWILPIGLMFLLWTFLSRRLSSAREMVFGFGKSPARLVAD